MSGAEPVDLVYTWVDDRWPGYAEALRAHASSTHDLNPNRTRDNLELLRYSLRSVAAYAPWVRNIHLLTCRPQVPAWLDASHPRLKITHHDQIMAPAVLPTFNSFAIISHLHRLPGLTRHFLYMEDDMLLGAPVSREDFVHADGRLRVFPRLTRAAPATQRDNTRISPWNAALALSNHLLNGRFGEAQRRQVNHVPLYVDSLLWQRMLDQWPGETQRLRASRFRAAGNYAPEYLYPYFALYSGQARAAGLHRTYRDSFYFPLENLLAQTWLQRAVLACLKPKFIAMNDNFGDTPNPRVVRFARALLERRYPEAGPFELSRPASTDGTAQETHRAAH